jgi:hypothetical protein
MADREYRRLSSLPFSAMSREESGALCAETRRRLAGIRFRYDPREFQGHHYWERGFLSCVIAGAAIPDGVTEDCFRVPWNRVIFQALRDLERLDVTGIEALTVFLRETGWLDDASKEDYLSGIESMIGMPSAVSGFALGLLRLNMGALI